MVGCTAKPKPEEIPQWSCVELLRNQHKGELSDFDKLILAISFTESRFDPNAVGTHEDRGVLQIVPIYAAEASRVSGVDYAPEDAFDIDKSLAMFRAVQEAHNPSMDMDTAIRLHNKSAAYKRVVLENLEMIERMERIL